MRGTLNNIKDGGFTGGYAGVAGSVSLDLTVHGAGT